MSQRSGFFVLDKAAGISSAHALTRLRKKLKIDKIGHAGTLDPFATGVLVALVNRATKLASDVGGGKKIYRTVFRFGVATDTDDQTGKVIALSPRLPERGEIDAIIPTFTGKIWQRPPRVSAVKVAGKRAYKRARAQEEFRIEEKEIEISGLEVHGFDGRDLDLSVSCGSGTYIRALARDMGERVGSCATVMSLRREASAPFTVADAVLWEDAQFEKMLPWDSIFPHLPRIPVSVAQARGLSRGDERVTAELAKNALPAEASRGQRIIFQLADNNASLGLLEYNGQEWKLWAYMGE